MTSADDADLLAEIADWPDRLEAACAVTRFRADLVRVVARCDSTQDLARDLGPGAVVTTGRQVAGRGRLGRRWADDAGAGIAVSLAVAPDDPARLSLAAGLAARQAVVDACPPAAARLGLKFPNDLVDRVTTRKVAGVLVESDGRTAVVGIGLNVHHRDWPADVPAISIADLLEPAVATPNRIDILERLPSRLEAMLARPIETLADEFRRQHAPTGAAVEVETPEGIVAGRLLDLDPCGRLDLEDAAGRRHRPVAATARILAWSPTAAGA